LKNIDLVTAIGRLLHNRQLRIEFEHAPEAVAIRLGLTDADSETFVRLDIGGIARQAEGLLSKRWHEVADLIPETTKELGREGRDLFRFYASNSWPAGHRRHYVDAFNFLKFLKKNDLAIGSANEMKTVRQLATRGYCRKKN
jgi:hypothetical protein